MENNANTSEIQERRQQQQQQRAGIDGPFPKLSAASSGTGLQTGIRQDYQTEDGKHSLPQELCCKPGHRTRRTECPRNARSAYPDHHAPWHLGEEEEEEEEEEWGNKEEEEEDDEEEEKEAKEDEEEDKEDEVRRMKGQGGGGEEREDEGTRRRRKRRGRMKGRGGVCGTFRGEREIESNQEENFAVAL
ncbi:cilia- and flagella-associated protein 251-like [Macrobrachium nipponense]|uniref:cilia- and flagella-associated protein 251-like n=1 Tax=Macrobrachium nipponense TaxID=159736 RepID=UPI0030C8A033